MSEEFLQQEENEALPRERHLPVIEQLSVAVSVLILLFGVTYIPEISREISEQGDTAQKAEAAQSISESSETKESSEDPLAHISLEAESAFVWDVKNQRVLFSKNPDKRLALASVTKLMTALVAYELLGTEDIVRIGGAAIRQDGESGLRDGEAFVSKDLLDLMLVTSSNDGAYAIAEAAGMSATSAAGIDAFIDAMNIRAEDIGLTQTTFRNPTGLDITTTESGAYGSARDVAFLMEFLITNYPEVLELTREDAARITSNTGELHNAQNTNTTVTDIPNIIASKTGYTDLAGGNLVIAYDAGLNRPIIISVLGSSRQGRFTDVVKLVSGTNDYLSK